MRGKIGTLAMLGAFVSLAAFVVQEAEARGGRGGGGGGRGGGGFQPRRIEQHESRWRRRHEPWRQHEPRGRKREPWQLQPRRQRRIGIQSWRQLQPSGRRRL